MCIGIIWNNSFLAGGRARAEARIDPRPLRTSRSTAHGAQVVWPLDYMGRAVSNGNVLINVYLLADRQTDRQTDTRLMASFLEQPGKAGTIKFKQIWTLLEQEMMGWQWHQLDHMQIICTSLESRQISTPARQQSFFYRPDDLPDTKPTVSKHWRQSNKPGIERLQACTR